MEKGVGTGESRDFDYTRANTTKMRRKLWVKVCQREVISGFDKSDLSKVVTTEAQL